MKIESIEASVLPIGTLRGTPCVIIRLGGEEMSSNEIIEAIRETKLRTVCFSGKITENPDLKPLMKDLTGINYQVVLVTDATDDIESVRTIKNLCFIIKTKAPSSDQNSVNGKIFPLLKEADEILFGVEEVKDYEDAEEFLKSRMITRPTVGFVFGKFSGENIALKAAIENSTKFPFPTRIYV